MKLNGSMCTIDRSSGLRPVNDYDRAFSRQAGSLKGLLLCGSFVPSGDEALRGEPLARSEKGAFSERLGSTISAVVLLFFAAAISTGCTESAPPAPPTPPPADYLATATDATSVSVANLPAVVYTDVTAEAGIRFRHENGSFGKKFLPETMGSGVVLFDADGDGRTDIFLLNGARWPGHEKSYAQPETSPATSQLLRNLGGMQFEDSSARMGLALLAMAMGGTAADVDGDGDQDLFVTGVGRNHFFRNDGGKFVECGAELGLQCAEWTDKDGKKHGAWGTSPAFLDYDRDGKVDLFVANYVRWSEATDIFATLNGKDKAFTTPELYPGDSCRLYRNAGGRFEDVTEKAGLHQPDGKSMGVSIEDIDGDGWVEILVSNDTQPNYLFRNNRDGTFSEKALDAGIAYSPDGRARAGMGIDALRERNSDSLAIAIGNFSREPVSVYREIGKGFFQDDGAASGIGPPTLPNLTFGLVFFDYDLDGRSDLFIVNGHIEPTIQEVQKEIHFEQPAQLFHNRGGGKYAEASGSAGEFFKKRIVGRGLAIGDLDGDGDIDAVVTTNGGPAHILRCDLAVPHRSLRLFLRSPDSSRDALGARVSVAAGGSTQRRMVRTGSSYLSQSELALTFGLGTLPAAAEVKIVWPDGKEETFTDVPAGKSFLVTKGEKRLAELK